MFSRPLSEISVGEVLRSVEESLALTKCVENDQKICESVNSCVTRKVWKKVTDSIADIVDSMTLEELIEEGGCGGLKGV